MIQLIKNIKKNWEEFVAFIICSLVSSWTCPNWFGSKNQIRIQFAEKIQLKRTIRSQTGHRCFLSLSLPQSMAVDSYGRIPRLISADIFTAIHHVRFSLRLFKYHSCPVNADYARFYLHIFYVIPLSLIVDIIIKIIARTVNTKRARAKTNNKGLVCVTSVFLCNCVIYLL